MALTTTPSELTATALTLTTAAQPNITSVGTLTGLDIGTNSHTGANPAFGITVDGANDYIAQFANTDATAGENHGVRILAGSNASDITIQVKNKDNNAHYMHITGAGLIGMGTSTPATDIAKFGGSAVGLSVAGGQPVVVVRASGNAQHVGYLGQAGDDTYLGALGGGDLYIQTGTGGTTKVTVQAGGNVGIADTTPAEKLSVTGAILSEGDHATAVNAMGAAAGILMHATGDTAYITATSNGNNHRYLSLRALNTGAANAHQVFLSYTGNVGIGTNAPGNTFVVKGAASTSPILEMINSDAEDGDTGRESTIRFSGFRSGGEAVINGQITGTHTTSGDNDYGGLTFFSNDATGIAERMRLNHFGRLGIGTNAPTSALSITATSTNHNNHLLHVYRPDGLSHTSEPFSSCLLYTSPSPRDGLLSRMPSSA